MRSVKEQLEYWDGVSADGPPCGVPADFERPPVPSFSKESRFARIGAEPASSLRRFAARHDASLYDLVLCAYQIVLHRYTGHEVISVGYVPSRCSPDRQGAGCPVVPIQAAIDGAQTVAEFVTAVSRLRREAESNSDLPFDVLARHLEGKSGERLFDTLFLDAAILRDAAVRRWLDGVFAVHSALLRRDLTLAVEDGEALSIRCEYDSDLYESATALRLLRHLEVLLLGMCEGGPGRKLSELRLLTEAERHELLSDLSGPSPSVDQSASDDGPETLPGWFEEQAARTPERIALVCGGDFLRYDELNRAANRVARRLRGAGVGPEVLAGLCMERSNHLVVGLLAILKAGGAYLPIDLAYPPERLAYILNDAQAPVLLTQRALVPRIPLTTARVLCIEDLIEPSGEAECDENPASSIGPDSLAYVIYTSGTTGRPKGSLVTHRNVTRLFAATDHWFGFDETDVWTLFHSCAFDFSVWEIWGALLHGGRLVVVPFMTSRSPEAFYDLLARERVTVLNQTPSAFRQLIAAEEASGQKELALRYVIFGGEALEMQSLRPWFDRHGDRSPRLINMYGITETTVHVTYRPLSRGDLGRASVIGRPIPDLRIYILDASGEPVPIGVPGEMYVGGAGVCRGYLDRPELTAERFVRNPFDGESNGLLYRTGDLARWLPDRDIEYLGRIDEQVKIRGFRIELGEIESVLCEHGSVRAAAVVAREDEPGNKRLAAYLVVDGREPSVDELRGHLQKKLPDYMVPAAFVFLQRLPLTTNGKLDRRALPVPDLERPGLGDGYQAPRTPVEETLASIWAGVLRLERVGVNDDFFALGGDSILGIQVISLARRQGLALTPKDLFQRGTVAELARAATAQESGGGREQSPAEGELPLTPIQHWFFEQELAEMHHYNQAFLFEVREPLNEDVLRAALAGVERHHDSLRLRFRRADGAWRQRYSEPGGDRLPVEWVDLSGAGAEWKSAVAQVVSRNHASLNIESGPLWRAVYMDLGAERGARLLIVAHHLAIDGVSWRILLEDIERAYLQSRDGEDVRLGPKTTSYRTWAERLEQYAGGGEIAAQADYWKALAGDPPQRLPVDLPDGRNTEGCVRTIKTRFTAEETRDLLQRVPRAYSTRIDDVLLTALAMAVERWTGRRRVDVSVEGHGREDLFEGVDLTRTVGWFTTIYPLRLELPEAGGYGEALKSVKEQLRAIPLRGLGYGVARYLRAGKTLEHREPDLILNYLGQLDTIVSGSRLFEFARESVDGWHSRLQSRRQLLELSSMVAGGRFEVEWSYSRELHRPETIERLSGEFEAALRGLIDHCVSIRTAGHTPSDFPLCGLDQTSLDALLEGRDEIEDIHPLAPMQLLFLARAAGDHRETLDQWQCALVGALDATSYQKAWNDVVERHSILRASFVVEGQREPLQLVHARVDPEWRVEDWRGVPLDEQNRRWETFLEEDRERGLALDAPPLMRFALFRLEDSRHRFLWSVPALLLDGWSWPLVFGDVSRCYEERIGGRTPSLDAGRPYRDYVAWLGSRSWEDSRAFWRSELETLTAPTRLPGEAVSGSLDGARFGKVSSVLDAACIHALQRVARGLRITESTLVDAAWALVLSRLSARPDVVFGVAFSGRPADLPGAESTVGPFTSNLPVRVRLSSEMRVDDFLRTLHERLMGLQSHQYASLAQIQSWSPVPLRQRLFDSLVVVQNYCVDEAARTLGDGVTIRDFEGPVHTSYPLLVLVEPADWRVSLIFDRELLSRSRVERWLADLIQLLETLPNVLSAAIGKVLDALPEPVVEMPATPVPARSRDHIPPQTDLERTIVRIWAGVLELDSLSIDENVFELGANSLLMVQLQRELCRALDQDISLVHLYQYPTVRSLARQLQGSEEDSRAAEYRCRAHRQRAAFARLREDKQR